MFEEIYLFKKQVLNEVDMSINLKKDLRFGLINFSLEGFWHQFPGWVSC